MTTIRTHKSITGKPPESCQDVNHAHKSNPVDCLSSVLRSDESIETSWNNGNVSRQSGWTPEQWLWIVLPTAAERLWVVLEVEESAPVVLWEIKTFRGANEFFSSAFVSALNQSPQVTVSITAYAAALYHFKKHKSTLLVCACVCVEKSICCLCQIKGSSTACVKVASRWFFLSYIDWEATKQANKYDPSFIVHVDICHWFLPLNQ